MSGGYGQYQRGGAFAGGIGGTAPAARGVGEVPAAPVVSYDTTADDTTAELIASAVGSIATGVIVGLVVPDHKLRWGFVAFMLSGIGYRLLVRASR